MKKKVLVVVLVTMLVVMLLPGVAFAKDLYDGEMYSLGDAGAGEIINIDPFATVTLTGTAPDNVQVKCGEGVTLNLEDVTLNCTTDEYCALTFTGVGNTLNLIGSSNLQSGYNQPGIKVEGSTVLTIQGFGNLNVTGGAYGAGIGSSSNAVGDGGTINLTSGSIVAIGGDNGAGIGGGQGSKVGTINISGGDVDAEGRLNSAGIGGGNNGSNGTVNITGGIVVAVGGDNAAGIGGGRSGNAGSITISGGDVLGASGIKAAGIGGGYNSVGTGTTITILGGLVEAEAFDGGAGIGGGAESSVGTINISGGNVYATGNAVGGAHDIGRGNLGTDGTLNIIGGPSIFLENGKDNSLTPEAPVPDLHVFNSSDEIPKHYRVPAKWTYPVALYGSIIPDPTPTPTPAITPTPDPAVSTPAPVVGTPEKVVNPQTGEFNDSSWIIGSLVIIMLVSSILLKKEDNQR